MSQPAHSAAGDAGTFDDRLSRGRLAALAAPAVPLSAMGLPLAIFVPPFYASLFQANGMSAAAALAVVGTTFMLVRVFDLVTDPIMGVVGDHFESRWGRRRHWCVLATPVIMLGVLLVFVVPLPAAVTPAYLLVSMVIFYTGSTLYTISHYAWGAEISRDYHERSRVTGFIHLASLLGSLTVLVPPAYMEYVVGETAGGRMAVLAFGLYVLALLPIATGLAVTLVPERPTAPAPKISFWQGARLVLNNRHMRRILLADLMVGIPGPVMASVFIFFLRDVVGGDKWNSIILIFFYGVTVAGVPFWLRVSRRLGKHRAFAISCVSHMVFITLFLLCGPGDVLGFALLVLACGFAHAGQPMLLRSMTADVGDSDTVESGGQRTGLYFSLITMTQKVGGAIAIGTAYPLLGWLGFSPGAASQTEQAMDAIRYIYSFLPASALIVAIVVIWGFRLTREEQERLRALLEQRDAARRRGEAPAAEAPGSPTAATRASRTG